MTIPRKYEPDDEAILYHYCDAASFLSICTNQTLRLNDLFSMNDSMELVWGYKIWDKIKDDLRDNLGSKFLNEITNILKLSADLGRRRSIAPSFTAGLDSDN
jgi:hypothetical protein